MTAVGIIPVLPGYKSRDTQLFWLSVAGLQLTEPRQHYPGYTFLAVDQSHFILNTSLYSW